MILTPLEKFEDFLNYKLGNFSNLVEAYNSKLYINEKQQARKLKIENGYIFIEGYKNDAIEIINTITHFIKKSIENYSNSVKFWLENNSYKIDCDNKKDILINMFDNSCVVLVYGATGTGKTTLIKSYIKFFVEERKLYLAHTNPAVDNVKRKVSASNCEFTTITKFIKNSKMIYVEYDIIIIDE